MGVNGAAQSVNILFIGLLWIGIVNGEPMILFLQILNADFDIFIDFQSGVVHFSQRRILFG